MEGERSYVDLLSKKGHSAPGGSALVPNMVRGGNGQCLNRPARGESAASTSELRSCFGARDCAWAIKSLSEAKRIQKKR